MERPKTAKEHAHAQESVFDFDNVPASTCDRPISECPHEACSKGGKNEQNKESTVAKSLPGTPAAALRRHSSLKENRTRGDNKHASDIASASAEQKRWSSRHLSLKLRKRGGCVEKSDSCHTLLNCPSTDSCIVASSKEKEKRTGHAWTTDPRLSESAGRKSPRGADRDTSQAAHFSSLDENTLRASLGACGYRHKSKNRLTTGPTPGPAGALSQGNSPLMSPLSPYERFEF
jgi:hypothetical protein